MTACDGYVGFCTYALAAAKDFADDVRREHLDRHTENRQCEDRRSAHGVHVRQCVRRRDAPKVEGVVDDGHEKVGGRDDRLFVVETIDRSVVRCLSTNEQLAKRAGRGRPCEEIREHARGNLAATPAAVRERGQPRSRGGEGSHGINLKELAEGSRSRTYQEAADAPIPGLKPSRTTGYEYLPQSSA